MTTSQSKAAIGPNMTPMVDVVMCILIFFMLGSTFLAPELALASNLPVGKGVGTLDLNAPAPPVRFMLSLETRGEATWMVASDGTQLPMGSPGIQDANNQAVSSFLAGKKAALSDWAQVIIAPQEKVPYQDVITLFDDCTRVQFKQVAFAPARQGH
jgi:biopolymer transport protein ExbD